MKVVIRSYIYILALSLGVSMIHGLTINANSSSPSTATSSTTSEPIYCGQCTIYAQVQADMWWETIYTTYAATIVYMVDNRTHSTITSSLISNNVTTSIPGTDIVSSYIDTSAGDGVVFITLNPGTYNFSYAPYLVQSNDIGVLSYDLSTSTGSQCLTAPDAFPDLVPEETIYTYTGSLQFNTQDLLNSAEGNGGDEFASSIASSLGLSSCTLSPGGSGELKVGVTVLTSESVQYTDAAETATSLDYSSTSTMPAAPSSIPPNLPAATSTAIATSVPSAAGEAGTSILTIVSLQSASGYLVNGATLTAGGPAATISNEIISAGPSGLEVIRGTSTSGLAGYILSGLGIVVTQTAATAAAVTNGVITIGSQAYTISAAPSGSGIVVGGQTLTSGGVVVVSGVTVSLASGGTGIVIGGTTTSPGVAAYTGNACRKSPAKYVWAVSLGLGVALVLLSC